MTSPSDYHGWTNRATWSANLWLNNDEQYYKEAAKMVFERHDVVVLARALARQCHRWWGGMTKDGCPLDDVNWLEIAKALKESETV